MYNVHLTHSLLCFEFVEFTLNKVKIAFLPLFASKCHLDLIFSLPFWLICAITICLATHEHWNYWLMYSAKLLFHTLNSADAFS